MREKVTTAIVEVIKKDTSDFLLAHFKGMGGGF
jgi:hypothetical protein